MNTKKILCLLFGHNDPVIEASVGEFNVWGTATLNESREETFRKWATQKRDCLRCGILLRDEENAKLYKSIY